MCIVFNQLSDKLKLYNALLGIEINKTSWNLIHKLIEG